MELEATILERLEELRRWQVEQQERLLKEQQEQRELLSFEQDRMYQPLGLSVQNMILEDSSSVQSQNLSSAEDVPRDGSPQVVVRGNDPRECTRETEELEKRLMSRDTVVSDNETQCGMQLSVPKLQLSTNRYLNFQCSSIDGFSPRSEIPADHGMRTPEKIQERVGELAMEGVELLDKPSNRFVTLDDLPVPSPKKDFTTLLEERLRDCEANAEDNAKNPKVCVKRPFLKKGEGLARFRPHPDGVAHNRRVRPRSQSLSASMRLSSSASTKTTGNPPKPKETARSSKTCANKSLTIPATAQTKLSLRNVPAPKPKVRSKSMSIATKPSVKPLPIDMNISSDIETKNLRETEEMRIFELLEEKAEHSSFCSNSSTVLALFRQSTPVKVANESKEKRRGNPEASTKKLEKSSYDANLEEIVRTTRSNMLAPGSPVAKIRETVIHKDYVISQRETGREEIVEGANSNGLSNRTIAAGTYKTTKHTTIQINNNNVNNNRNNNNDNEANDNYKSFSDSRKEDPNSDDNANERDKRGTDNTEEASNVSLHVRFAEYNEYNEYKTIDLTDASFMSNASSQHGGYNADVKAWSDRSTSPDSSDVENLSSVKNEQLFQDEETTDQTTDNEDEDYTSTNDEESYDETNATITEANGKSRSSINDEPENCNDSGSTIVRDDEDDVTPNKIEKSHASGTIFKSELLKTRLAELEREIEIFRKENSSLAAQRKKLQEETKRLNREHKLREDNLERERKLNEDTLQEERKRLAREKAALENRLKDAREKSLRDKQERQEIQTLRDQLDELREDACQKESRWQAAQARQKSQIRVLQTENARLKQELDKLRASRNNNLRHRRQPVATNTRSIHQISKQLENRRKINARKDSSSDEEKIASIVDNALIADYENCEMDNRSPIAEDENDGDGIHDSPSPPTIKCDEDLRKKRSLYANLLNEATEGLRGNEEILLGKRDKENLPRNSLDRGRETEVPPSDSGERIMRDIGSSSIEKMRQKSPAAQTLEKVTEVQKSPQTQIRPDVRRWSDGPICQNDRTSQSAIKTQDVREIKCPDGHLEYWYPNGNVKKIYPDRSVVKMIYYNGDVRESSEDGSVKYFYASTRTWHTTLPDGLEILEFPDGQVERRMKDGTNEVSFPDGSVRLLHADGTEKWVLPDGTVVETFPDGNKILSFPNGQREVHTKEHKRREYPDGTVKLVYPDGTQETRYSTGRVRVKDKDGNLIMDVHHR